jgi:hypothetical protein
MKQLSDTSPEAQRVLTEAYRAMTPERKWSLMSDLYRFGRQLHAAGFRMRQPAATSADIRDDWLATHFRSLPRRFGRTVEVDVNQPLDHERVLHEVVAAFESLGIGYALGGSLASSIYGFTRLTADADIMVEPFEGKEARLIDCFGDDYYVSREGVGRALRDRTSFNIINSSMGYKVDVFIQNETAFHHSVMQRRTPFLPSSVGKRPINIVSAEDIILLKLDWFRQEGESSDNQWSDILGVLRTQAQRLDRSYLEQWAKELGVLDLLESSLQAASS